MDNSLPQAELVLLGQGNLSQYQKPVLRATLNTERVTLGIDETKVTICIHNLAYQGQVLVEDQHCAIGFDEQKKAFYLQNFTPTYGTFVNQHLVPPHAITWLQDGDEIQLGNHRHGGAVLRIYLADDIAGSGDQTQPENGYLDILDRPEFLPH